MVGYENLKDLKIVNRRQCDKLNKHLKEYNAEATWHQFYNSDRGYCELTFINTGNFGINFVKSEINSIIIEDSKLGMEFIRDSYASSIHIRDSRVPEEFATSSTFGEIYFGADNKQAPGTIIDKLKLDNADIYHLEERKNSKIRNFINESSYVPNE